MADRYEVIAENGGIKFEIVTSDQVGLFGEPIIQACTFRQVMRPMMERHVLGTYNSEEAARRRLEEEMSK